MKFKQQKQHKSKHDSPVAQELLVCIKKLYTQGNHERAKLMEAKYRSRYGKFSEIEAIK